MSKRQWFDLAVTLTIAVIGLFASYLIYGEAVRALIQGYPTVAMAEWYCVVAAWFLLPTVALFRWLARVLHWTDK